MAETLAEVNAAYAQFEAEYPEAANYFCFLAGFNAGMNSEYADAS